MNGMNNIEIVRYERKYQSTLIDLLQHIWTGLTPEERKAKFEWRYLDNPYTTQPFIYLALEGEQMAGFRAFVVQVFKVDQKVIRIFSPADAIVHPNYRRLGIFSKLNNAMINDINRLFPEQAAILNLSSNTLSTPGYLKQNWQRANAQKAYAFRVSLINFIRVSIIKKRTYQLTPKILTRGNLTFEISGEIKSKELASFVNWSRNVRKITNIRDEGYFKWRYSAKSGTDYSYLYCYSDKQLVGYAICKKISPYQYVLEEYLAADTAILKKVVSCLIRFYQIPVLRTLAISADQKSLLRSLRFVVESKFLQKIFKVNRLPVLIRSTRIDPADQDLLINNINMLDMNSWVIFQADVH